MISSVNNAQVKRIVALRDKAKERKKEDCFVVEGRKMFLEAPEESILSVYVTEDYLRKWGKDERLLNLPYEIVTSEVLRKMSDTQTPQGVLCVVKQQHYDWEALLAGEKTLLMVLEDIQDPGNLGTIIRTAEGAGVTGILMSSGTADLYNPKVIRSTMGSVYRMPYRYTEDLGAAIRELQSKGIRIYAAHLKGKHSYSEENYTGATGFLIGNEGNGLREETARVADTFIRIPMAGKVESLNAAVASALLMYEASRQRNLTPVP